jgi:hypothetical protein
VPRVVVGVELVLISSSRSIGEGTRSIRLYISTFTFVSYIKDWREYHYPIRTNRIDIIIEVETD